MVFLYQVSNQIKNQVAHFRPELVAHFNPESVAHFEPEYPPNQLPNEKGLIFLKMTVIDWVNFTIHHSQRHIQQIKGIIKGYSGT
ncbi:hypothetical protein EGI24_14120 [Lacihabitans sp. CS3-21]|nr:hypothetical protein [Lacihabitans sp. CS3-21]